MIFVVVQGLLQSAQALGSGGLSHGVGFRV